MELSMCLKITHLRIVKGDTLRKKHNKLCKLGVYGDLYNNVLNYSNYQKY